MEDYQSIHTGEQIDSAISEVARTVSVSGLDTMLSGVDIKDAAALDALTGEWALLADYPNGNVPVGRVLMFTDSMYHQVTQVVVSNFLLSEDGTFGQAHMDHRVFAYRRAWGLRSPQTELVPNGAWSPWEPFIPTATSDAPGLLSATDADRLAAMERISAKKINGNTLFKLTTASTADDVRAALSYGGSEPVTSADLDLCYLRGLTLRDVTSGAPVMVEWTGSAYVLLSLSRYHQQMQPKLRSVALVAADDGTLTVTVAGRTDSVVTPGTATVSAAGLMSRDDKVLSVRLSRQVLELGDFATSGAAEKAAMQPAVSGDNSVSLIRYTVSASRKSGLILQQVGSNKTIQLLLWDGNPKMRHLYFTNDQRTQIDTFYNTGFYWCWPTQLHYETATRSLDLGFFSDKFNGAVTLPLATTAAAGLMSRDDKENLDAMVAASSSPASVLQAATVADVVGEVKEEIVSISPSQQAKASIVYSTARRKFLWRVVDGFPQVGQEPTYKYYSAPSVGEPYETKADNGTWTIREGLLVRSLADGSLLLFYGSSPRRILTEEVTS